ncbi:hypothetical protein [Gudongella sp. DL1XJH-153]|uniref:hypothetical protein n=1 Tax=Gudongella sp. DL1XJH-153 TaxID=3409804 RepID=UPI003BB77957
MTNKISKKIFSFILVVILIILGSYLMGFRLSEEPTDSNVASHFIFDYYTGSIGGRVDGSDKLDKLSSLMDKDTFKDAADEGLISKEGIAGNGFLEEIDTNQVMLSPVSDEDMEKTFKYQANTRLKLGEDSIHTVRFNGEITVGDQSGSWFVTGFNPDFENIEVMTTYGRSYIRIANRSHESMEEAKVTFNGIDQTLHLMGDERVIQIQMPSNREQIFSVEVVLEDGLTVTNQFDGDFSDGKNVDLVVQENEKDQLEITHASVLTGITDELREMDYLPDRQLVEYEVSKLLGGRPILKTEADDNDSRSAIIRALADHSLRYKTVEEVDLNELEEYYRIDEYSTLSGEPRYYGIFMENDKYILQRGDGAASEISGESYKGIVELLN